MTRLCWHEDCEGSWVYWNGEGECQGPRIIINRRRATSTTLTWFNDRLGKNSLSVKIKSSSHIYSSSNQWQLTESQYDDQLIFKSGDQMEVTFAHQPIPPGEWLEVDPHFIFSLDCVSGELKKEIRDDCMSFQPYEEKSLIPLTFPEAHNHLKDLLIKKVKVYCVKESSTANILFSGGLDSTILAAIAALAEFKVINLWNVSFAGAEAPDRLTSLLSYVNLQRTYDQAQFNYYARDITESEHSFKRQAILKAIYPKESLMDFTIGSTIYFASELKGRLISLTDAEIILQDFQYRPPKTIDVHDLCCKPKVVPDKREEEEEQRTLLKWCAKCVKYARKYDCSSGFCKSCCRQIGLADPEYLCKAHGVNKHLNPARGQRSSEVELRLSALWPEIYERSAPTICGLREESLVVLCGNGADELFGGYSRYSTREMHGSLQGWRDEMVADLDRLWSRNFNRDNRVMFAASAGRFNCQLPFFETEIIEWVRSISNEDLWHGVLHDPEFANNKALLREMCRYSLGLNQTAAFRKRAMQFGSRSAMTIFNDSETSRRSLKGTSTNWLKKININDPTQAGGDPTQADPTQADPTEGDPADEPHLHHHPEGPISF